MRRLLIFCWIHWYFTWLCLLPFAETFKLQLQHRTLLVKIHCDFVIPVRTPPGGGGVPPRILTNKRILACFLGNKEKWEDPGRRQAARKFHQYLIDFVKEIASEEGIFQNFPPAAGNLQYYIVEFIWINLLTIYYCVLHLYSEFSSDREPQPHQQSV